MIDNKLLDCRIIFLSGEVNEESANKVITQLLYLDSINNDDIALYINSPGGHVTSGLAIIDCMNVIKSDVKTFCVGKCYSMGAVILACGAKGNRFTLEHSEIMIHSPSTYTEGKAEEIELSAKRIINTKEVLTELLAKNSNERKKKISKLLTVDYFMNSVEAINFGIVDKILKSS